MKTPSARPLFIVTVTPECYQRLSSLRSLETPQRHRFSACLAIFLPALLHTFISTFHRLHIDVKPQQFSKLDGTPHSAMSLSQRRTWDLGVNPNEAFQHPDLQRKKNGRARDVSHVLLCSNYIPKASWAAAGLHLAELPQCSCPAGLNTLTYKMPIDLCDSWKQQLLLSSLLIFNPQPWQNR